MSGRSVIVVGAGPGGLTCAMLLAHRGFEVTVFEQQDQVGGRNARLQEAGFSFDTGPTFLMMQFILREMFAETGRNIDDYLDIRRLDPMYRLRFHDFELRATGDRVQMRQQLAAIVPGGDAGYDRFMQQEQKRFEKLFSCIQKPYSSVRDFIDWRLIQAVPYLSAGRSMFDKLGDYFSVDELRLAFTFQSKYLGMSAWECPAFFNIIPYVEHGYGVYHVTGGLNAISHAMQRVVGQDGGRVEVGTPVRRVRVRDGAARGVELEDGRRVAADDVVINADFGHAATTLFREGQLRRYSARRLERKRLSCSTFMLYLGLDTCYDIPHHNIFFARQYRKNVEEIFNTLRLSDECSFYIQNPCPIDPGLAPAGKSALYVLVPVPNQRSGIDWDAEAEGFRNRILDQIEERTELGDLRQHIVAERIITPRNWEQDYSVYGGATFNLGHNWGQMLVFRPHNRFEEVANCYLVGGGTHPGSGLPTIYESARISANLLCQARKVPFESPGGLETKHVTR